MIYHEQTVSLKSETTFLAYKVPDYYHFSFIMLYKVMTNF